MSKSNLQIMVEHYNYKWPTDGDILYYWYPGMYSSNPPPKMLYCTSYSRNDFENYVKENKIEV